MRLDVEAEKSKGMLQDGICSYTLVVDRQRLQASVFLCIIHGVQY